MSPQMKERTKNRNEKEGGREREAFDGGKVKRIRATMEASKNLGHERANNDD